MSGINKVIIIGNCGKDPETRYTSDQKAVSSISIATSESWKDKQGNKKELTEWHNIVFFGRLAEIAGEYLKKGSKVYIEGKLKTDKWQDQQGNDRYTTNIIANQMQMLDSRGDASGSDGQSKNDTSNSSGQRDDYQKQPDSFDDDIPF